MPAGDRFHYIGELEQVFPTLRGTVVAGPSVEHAEDDAEVNGGVGVVLRCGDELELGSGSEEPSHPYLLTPAALESFRTYIASLGPAPEADKAKPKSK